MTAPAPRRSAQPRLGRIARLRRYLQGVQERFRQRRDLWRAAGPNGQEPDAAAGGPAQGVSAPASPSSGPAPGRDPLQGPLWTVLRGVRAVWRLGTRLARVASYIASDRLATRARGNPSGLTSGTRSSAASPSQSPPRGGHYPVTGSGGKQHADGPSPFAQVARQASMDTLQGMDGFVQGLGGQTADGDDTSLADSLGVHGSSPLLTRGTGSTQSRSAASTVPRGSQAAVATAAAGRSGPADRTSPDPRRGDEANSTVQAVAGMTSPRQSTAAPSGSSAARPYQPQTAKPRRARSV